MALTAYFFLILCLIVAATLALASGAQFAHGRRNGLIWMERGHKILTGGLAASAAILLGALMACDFSLAYVAEHTNRALPLPYRTAAFWAGQEGSLLFWAVAAAVICLLFQRSHAYTRLTERTRLLFWMLHFLAMAFFLLLLASWCNPFAVLPHTSPDGEGLNPILRHPAMILHPPLLLLGYAGFITPACLAAAQSFSGRDNTEILWSLCARPYTLAAWLALTAGIILGAWWSYMELGWGGYWAWDPVENASLVPWLLTTALLHTIALERRRPILARTNVFLCILTFAATLIATWLTRGGAADSLHSFSQSPVKTPLLLAAFFSAALALATALNPQGNSRGKLPPKAEALPGPTSRTGLILLGIWLLLALATIILTATVWPNLSGLVLPHPTSLTPDFYNRVCPPLFVAVTALIFIAFLREPQGNFPVKRLGIWLLTLGIPLLAILGTKNIVSTLAALFSIAILALAFSRLAKLRNRGDRGRINLSVYGIHLGFALMVLGAAISGPYKLETRVALAQGEQSSLGGYTFTLMKSTFAPDKSWQSITHRVDLAVAGSDGGPLGTLAPTEVLWPKSGLLTREAAILSSFSRDIYTALLGRNGDKSVILLSIHPLINWLWLGGALTCLAAALRLAQRERRAPRGNAL